MCKKIDSIINKFNDKEFSGEGLCFLFHSVKKNQDIIENFNLITAELPDFIKEQGDPEYENYLDSLFKLYFLTSVEEVYFREKFLSHIHTNTARKLMRDFKDNLCIETLKQLNDYMEILKPEHYQGVIDCINKDSTKKFYQIDKTKNIAMTIHSAKGLEFRNVVLHKDDFKDMKDMKKDLKERQDNENLFYVACTRAEKRLFFV